MKVSVFQKTTTATTTTKKNKKNEDQTKNYFTFSVFGIIYNLLFPFTNTGRIIDELFLPKLWTTICTS